MREVRVGVKVVSVRASGSSPLVEIIAEVGREPDEIVEVSWRCKADDAPRVGDAVAMRLVGLPRDQTLLQVLGLDAMGLGK